MQLLFDDTEYMLNFRTNRGLCVFCFLCVILSAFAQLLHLGWTTVDFATGLISGDRIVTFFCSGITAVAVNDPFFSSQQL